MPAANHRHSEAARLGAVAMSGATLLVGRSLQPGLQAPLAFGAAVPLLGEAVDDFLEKGITSHVLEALAVGISIGRSDFLAANTTSFCSPWANTSKSPSNTVRTNCSSTCCARRAARYGSSATASRR
ncbi:hypothetical protein ACFSVK_06910 [Azorhizophilus paspali]|uniref:hypothetical protein n=1 Tax=Azorhizophilus paspali TaxID=69963 RepID=UPI00362B665C